MVGATSSIRDRSFFLIIVPKIKIYSLTWPSGVSSSSLFDSRAVGCASSSTFCEATGDDTDEEAGLPAGGVCGDTARVGDACDACRGDDADDDELTGDVFACCLGDDVGDDDLDDDVFAGGLGDDADDDDDLTGDACSRIRGLGDDIDDDDLIGDVCPEGDLGDGDPVGDAIAAG